MSNNNNLNLNLNPEQQMAFDAIVKGSNSVFLTGNAGTGKSYVVKAAIAALRKDGKIVEVCASTALAAMAIDGTTVHRAFRIFPKFNTANKTYTLESLIKETIDDMVSTKKGRQRSEFIENIDVVVIDEVSMLHRTDLVRLESQLRQYGPDRNKPYGGIRMVFVGDFLQLEPVSNDRNPANPDDGTSAFAFEAKGVWRDAGVQTHILSTIVRQQDEEFATFLNNIRLGVWEPWMQPIVDRCKKSPTTDVPHFVSTNAEADKINERKLAELPGKLVTIESIDKNPPKFVGGLVQEDVGYWDGKTLALRYLKLKVGALVLCLTNSPTTYEVSGKGKKVDPYSANNESGLINGDSGIVTGFDSHDGQIIPIVHWTRTNQKVGMGLKTFGFGDPKECRIQVPIKPCWAMTVHKAQGMTLDAAAINVSSAFAAGQVYVALSRVRTLDGLYILGFDPKKIIVHDRAKKFYNFHQQVKVEETTRPKEEEEEVKTPMFKQDKYKFLSNMYPVSIEGYMSVESFYQAMKTQDKGLRAKVRQMDGYEAKKFGRTIAVRGDWEQIKLTVMRHALNIKFAPGTALAEMLIATGRVELVETNNWHDNFWGDCYCEKCVNVKGENHLGKMLMEIRDNFGNNDSHVIPKNPTTPQGGEIMSKEPEKFVIAGTGTRGIVGADAKHEQFRTPESVYNRVIAFLTDLLLQAKAKHKGNLVVMSGMAQGFDECLAKAAIAAEVPLTVAIPSRGYGAYYWGNPNNSASKTNRLDEFNEICKYAQSTGGVTYTCGCTVESTLADCRNSGHIKRGGQQNFERNQYMVDNCNVLWVYAPNYIHGTIPNAGDSGTGDCLRRAQKAGRRYVFIAMPDDGNPVVVGPNGAPSGGGVAKQKGENMPRALNKKTDNIPSDAVYVGRPSKWGNPFVIGDDGDRAQVIEKFRDYLVSNESLMSEVKELRGKDLVCWCSPEPCHADVLIEIANGPDDEKPVEQDGPKTSPTNDNQLTADNNNGTQNNKEEKVKKGKFHGIYATDKGLVRMATNRIESFDPASIVEEFDMGTYSFAFLNHFFGETGYVMEAGKIKNPDDRILTKPNKSTTLLSSTAETQYNLILHETGWLTGLENIGLVFKNSKKMGKRNIEIFRQTSAFGYFENLNILVQDPVDLNVDEKIVDGISAISQSFAVKLFLNNPTATEEWVTSKISDIYEGKMMIVSLRVITPMGMIKGNAIILPDRKMNGHDIWTFTPNVKTELSTTGWHWATIEPSYGKLPLRTDDLTMAIYYGIPGLLDETMLLECFENALKAQVDQIIGQTDEFDFMKSVQESMSLDKDNPNRSSLIRSINEIEHYLKANDLDITMSQTLMYLKANGFGMFTGVLNKYSKPMPFGEAYTTDNGQWFPVPYAYRAHIMTREVLEIFGFKFKNKPSHIGFYDNKTHCFVVPGKFFIENYTNHGGYDEDDTINVFIRKVDDKMKAFLLRNPNDFGEWSMIDVLESEIKNCYHTYSENVPTMSEADLRAKVPQLTDMIENQVIKYVYGELPGAAKLKISDTYSPDDEARIRIGSVLLPGGTGQTVLPKILHYGIVKKPLVKQLVSNEQIIDAVQQGIATPEDFGLMTAFCNDVYQKIVRWLHSTGNLVDYYWYATRMIKAPKAYRSYGFWSDGHSFIADKDKSPLIKLMLERESIARSYYSQLVNWANNSVKAPEILRENADRNAVLAISSKFEAMTASYRSSNKTTWAKNLVKTMLKRDESDGEAYTNETVIKMYLYGILMKRRKANSNWDQWLFSVDKNSSIQPIHFLVRAINDLRSNLGN